MPIYDAAVRYRENGVPLVVMALATSMELAPSRDWAAKGTLLLGVKRLSRQEL